MPSKFFLQTYNIRFISIESLGNGWIVSHGHGTNRNRYKMKEAYIFTPTCQLHNQPCMITGLLLHFPFLLQFQFPFLKEVSFCYFKDNLWAKLLREHKYGAFPIGTINKSFVEGTEVCLFLLLVSLFSIVIFGHLAHSINFPFYDMFF